MTSATTNITAKVTASRGSATYLDVAPELEITILVEDALVENTILALETIGGQGEIIVSSVDGIVRYGEEPRAATPAPSALLAKRAGTIPLHTAPARA